MSFTTNQSIIFDLITNQSINLWFDARLFQYDILKLYPWATPLHIHPSGDPKWLAPVIRGFGTSSPEIRGLANWSSIYFPKPFCCQHQVMVLRWWWDHFFGKCAQQKPMMCWDSASVFSKKFDYSMWKIETNTRKRIAKKNISCGNASHVRNCHCVRSEHFQKLPRVDSSLPERLNSLVLGSKHGIPLILSRHRAFFVVLNNLWKQHQLVWPQDFKRIWQPEFLQNHQVIIKNTNLILLAGGGFILWFFVYTQQNNRGLDELITRRSHTFRTNG